MPSITSIVVVSSRVVPARGRSNPRPYPEDLPLPVEESIRLPLGSSAGHVGWVRAWWAWVVGGRDPVDNLFGFPIVLAVLTRFR